MAWDTADMETVSVARWDVGLGMVTNYTTWMAAHRHNIKSQQSGVMQFVWRWHQDYGTTMFFPEKSKLEQLFSINVHFTYAY